MVKALSDHLSDVPIVALVDADAYGLDILSVYKYGSQGLRHENGKLAAHRIEWLGIRASELSEFDIDVDMLIPITKHDQKKALEMLRRPSDVLPPEWRKGLARILKTRRKAEIEILASVRSHGQEPERSYLVPYLCRKISHFVSAQCPHD